MMSNYGSWFMVQGTVLKRDAVGCRPAIWNGILNIGISLQTTIVVHSVQYHSSATAFIRLIVSFVVHSAFAIKR